MLTRSRAPTQATCCCRSRQSVVAFAYCRLPSRACTHRFSRSSSSSRCRPSRDRAALSLPYPFDALRLAGRVRPYLASRVQPLVFHLLHLAHLASRRYPFFAAVSWFSTPLHQLLGASSGRKARHLRHACSSTCNMTRKRVMRYKEVHCLAGRRTARAHVAPLIYPADERALFLFNTICLARFIV